MNRTPRTRPSGSVSRRTFIRHIGIGGATLPLVLPPLVRAASANEKLNIAGVGVGGKGYSDITLTSVGQNVVALCDVDQGKTGNAGIGKAAEDFPEARRYADWRKLLEDSNDIDGVTVSTPDHMHAPIAMAAMALGKHVYVQKPMTHNIYEARQMRLTAKKHNVVTQMGNQGHSSIGYRMAVQLLQSGAIGRIKETHSWTNRPTWPQGMDRPQEKMQPPENLKWNLWLGVAPWRPYHQDLEGRKGTYHPFSWRGWLDFGTGSLGDMGCHILDPVVWSLKLGAPRAVWSDGPKPNTESYPEWCTVHWEFGGTDVTAGDRVIVTWYDGGHFPPDSVNPLRDLPERRLPSSGSIFVGTEGTVLLPHGGTSSPEFFPSELNREIQRPKLEAHDHYMQWTNACKGQDKTSSHFDYAGPLTETVVMGNIAMRFGSKRLEWDANNLRFTNEPAANEFVRRQYRKGWEVPGLA